MATSTGELKSPRTDDIRELQRFYNQLVEKIKELEARIAVLEAA